MNQSDDLKIIQIANLNPKLEYKFEECEFCAFHEVEPGVCEDCEDASEFEPMEEDALESLKEAA